MVAEDITPGLGTEAVLQTPLLGVGTDGVVVEEVEDAHALVLAQPEVFSDLAAERGPGLAAVDEAELAVHHREAGLGEGLEIFRTETAEHQVVLVDTFRGSVGSHRHGIDHLGIELAEEGDDGVGGDAVVEVVLVVGGLVAGEVETVAADGGRGVGGRSIRRGAGLAEEGDGQNRDRDVEQVCHSSVKHFKFFV